MSLANTFFCFHHVNYDHLFLLHGYSLTFWGRQFYWLWTQLSFVMFFSFYFRIIALLGILFLVGSFYLKYLTLSSLFFLQNSRWKIHLQSYGQSPCVWWLTFLLLLSQFSLYFSLARCVRMCLSCLITGVEGGPWTQMNLDFHFSPHLISFQPFSFKYTLCIFLFLLSFWDSKTLFLWMMSHSISLLLLTSFSFCFFPVGWFQMTCP